MTTILIGPRVKLETLTVDDASPDYLEWLNDPDVLRYRNAPASTSWLDLLSWIEDKPADSERFTIKVRGHHIGNLSLDGIIPGETADLGIMIGAKDVWGHGYGREAISLLADHGLLDMGLKRITASSPNPAFNAIMRKLGWEHLRTDRAAFRGLDMEHWTRISSPGTDRS